MSEFNRSKLHAQMDLVSDQLERDRDALCFAIGWEVDGLKQRIAEGTREWQRLYDAAISQQEVA